MASANDDTVALTAHCLCKANIFKATVPKSKLPLLAYICHCDSCRHTTGALYSADTRWPERRANVNVSKLKVFSFSPNLDLLFCPTCSTPMFWARPLDETHPLGVFTGALTNEKPELIRFVEQTFVADTLDGGASVWFRHPNADGSEIKRFDICSEIGRAKELPKKRPSPSKLTGYEAKKEDSILIRCKCKGVNFILHRGDYSGRKEEELPFNIDPKTHKLLGSFCGCNSCRLQSGIDVFNWTFSEMKHVSFSQSEKPFPTCSEDLKKLVDVKDAAVGTLTYYTSSPEVQRYFCSNCSACIFFAVSSRPGLIDVAIGVLDASDGARAEGLISWTFGGKLSYREDGDGGWRQGLFDRVEMDAEEYRMKRGYPKNMRRLAQESQSKAEK